MIKVVDKFLIVKWLLSHVGVLKELSAIVAQWSEVTTLAERLEIVYAVAKALLPVIDTFPLFTAQAISEEEGDQIMVTAQAAAGIPIPVLVSVVVPIVSALIQLIRSR